MINTRKEYLVLAAGVITVSFAAILIRLTTAPAPVIAFYRLGLSSALLFPFTLVNYRSELKVIINKKYWFSLFCGGFFLASHFLLWITSLNYTTVASSVVFVATQPIFVALGAYFIFKDKISPKLILGILIAIGGSIIIGISDLKIEGSYLYGDLLALGGAVMIAGYVLIASKLRKRLALIPYVFVIYSITTIFLYLFIQLTGYSLLGYKLKDYIIFFLLAVGPNIIGHTCINWTLKYVSPSVVSASILGEPVGSTLLAFLILKEVPPLGTLIGSIIILIGIYIAAQEDSKRIS